MKRVILTAGHQARSGAGANGFAEGEQSIIFRNMIARRLASLGVDAYTDSDNDDLKAVVSKLKRSVRKTDICVDLHFNSSANPSASGCEVFVPDNPTSDEKQLAEKLLNALAASLKLKNRGVKTESLTRHGKIAMLSGFDCCNVLIEVCFLSNKNDMNAYLNAREELSGTLAKAIYSQIKEL